ncbi:hypothetical protein HanIR_Chr16g0821321 [Helianthus annuus]|nr:hypothetical protein HanIR_Chr16g0821321 [Helianthus annuus]
MRSRFKRFHRIDTRTDFLSYIFKSRCGYKTYTAVIFAQLQNSFKSLSFKKRNLIQLLFFRKSLTYKLTKCTYTRILVSL